MPSLEECAKTNKWAAWTLEENKKKEEMRKKSQAKAKATIDYLKNKPKAILDFEADVVKYTGKRLTYDDRTANGLTRFIIDYINFYGGCARRINVGGINVGGDRWRTSGSTKGVADVNACIQGKFVDLEVKAGKDKPRDAQLVQQQRIRSAGGVYEFIHNAEEFERVYKEITKQYS